MPFKVPDYFCAICCHEGDRACSLPWQTVHLELLCDEDACHEPLGLLNGVHLVLGGWCGSGHAQLMQAVI